MAITTIDGAIAGMQPTRFIAKAVTPTVVAGRPWSTWALGGSPGAGAFDTTLNGVTLSSSSSLVNGQIPHFDPGSGNAYLANFGGQLTQAANVLLLDRIWHNGGINITSTSAQSITSPTWPARDANGATNGVGIVLAVEVSAGTGAGTPTITIGYTNSSGTGSRTATNIQATAASSAAGSFYLIGLQAGDIGVQSVQSITLSATWTSGTINIVAFRLLAALPVLGQTPFSLDSLTSGFPRIYNGTVPFIAFVPSTTTASNFTGFYTETHG